MFTRSFSDPYENVINLDRNKKIITLVFEKYFMGVA